jgi:hypothetical protein
MITNLLGVSTFSPYKNAYSLLGSNAFTQPLMIFAGGPAQANPNAAFYWTIKSGTTEKSLESWGIKNVRIELVSQASDLMTFDLTSEEMDDAGPFVEGSTIRLYKNRRTNAGGVFVEGTSFFYGRVSRIVRNGTGKEETISYQVDGPWWWLDNLVFQQAWKVWTGGVESQENLSHLFLGLKEDGTKLTTGEQIAQVVTWANNKGAPIFVSTGYPSVQIPSREVKDITCGEAIRLMLRFHPDAVTWFDYSTTVPTLKIGARTSLLPMQLTIGQSPLSTVNITGRTDLSVPVVVLKFEQSNTIQGQVKLATAKQIYPTEGVSEYSFGAMVATVQLMGQTSNYNVGQVSVRKIVPMGYDLDTNTQDWQWWAQRNSWLNDPRVTGLQILSWAIYDESGRETTIPYSNFVSQGDFASWMQINSSGNPWNGDLTIAHSYALAQRVKIAARAKVSYLNGSGTDNNKQTISIETLSANVTATNINYGDHLFTTLQSFVQGEDIPDRLAESLYTSLHEPHFEGSVTMGEAECLDWLQSNPGCSSILGMGMYLNIAGGKTEWATMKALIQSVSMDLASGITTLKFGPPGHLGAADLVELLRVNRNRIAYTAPEIRSTGVVSSAGHSVEGAMLNGASESSSGGLSFEKMTIAPLESSSVPHTTTITLDPQTISGKQAEFRQCSVCAIVNGVQVNKKAWVLMTTPEDIT